MRANLALPVILPWPRAISSGNWYWPHNSLVIQSQSIWTSWRMPNWSGPIPEPVTSVRLPHSAPAPNASCMLQALLQAPLELFLGGESVVPRGGHAGHRRAGEVVVPPALDDGVERVRRPSRRRFRPSSALLLKTEDFDRQDRHRLVAEHALVGLDLAGEAGVPDHVGQAEILQPGRRRRRQRRLDRIDQRVEQRRRRPVRIARMDVEVEVDGERPHRRRAERLGLGGLRFLRQEQRRLLGRRDVAPVAQPPLAGDERRRRGDAGEQRRIDRLARDHVVTARAAAASAARVSAARISGAMSARAERMNERSGIAAGGTDTRAKKRAWPRHGKARARPRCGSTRRAGRMPPYSWIAA